MEPENIKFQANLNYYLLTLFAILIIAFEVANFVDPVIEPQLDGFELLRLLGFPAA